jgi:DNA-directed RNA polymerase specialized sigma24 family protein
MSTDRRSTAAPNQRWVLTQEAFDALLAWLNPEREQAGKRYEDIRRRLVKIFTYRGCQEPEDLADETINRVACKVGEIAGTYSGDPALYFYGVANKIHHESLRKRPTPPCPPPRPPGIEQEYECLERCMEALGTHSRELVLQYYQEDKRAKIEHRRAMAERLGVPINALRIRAHRIRAALRDCVTDCLARRAG